MRHRSQELLKLTDDQWAALEIPEFLRRRPGENPRYGSGAPAPTRPTPPKRRGVARRIVREFTE